MMVRSPISRRVVLALSISLFVTGCASFSGTTSPAVVFQSYDLPSTLEANAVIRAVERAFARTLSKPPQIVEGSVPSPLPAMPARFTVEDRLVHLDRLGTVNIPEVICPESMAIVQSLVADTSESSAVHKYIGCIQAYAGGYRVSVVDSRMVAHGSDAVVRATGSGPSSGPDPLARITLALREQISAARLVAGAYAQESATPVWRTSAKTATSLESTMGKRRTSLASSPGSAAAPHAAYREESVVSTTPLVCLAPRGETASVRSARGDGPVVTVLRQGSILAVAEPVDAAHFRVETENGMTGWVDRSDVRRLPCPIG